MNSLQELNSWGAIEVDYLDARPSQVIFNRVTPLGPVDQTFDAYASPVRQVTPQPGIEIVEIVNYQTANTRYRVTVKSGSSGFPGSTVTFPPLPSGLVLTQVGDVYTISNIDRVTDWDAVKNFIWQLPSNFANYPQWYLECTIIYYSSSLGRDVETTWEIYDDRFYVVAELLSSVTLAAQCGVIKPLNATLNSNFTTYALGGVQFIAVVSNISSAATLSCEAQLNATNFISTSSMIIDAVKTARGRGNIVSTITQSTNAVASCVNLDPRSYLANIGNAIFSTNNPLVDTPNGEADSFSITLSSSLGYFAANATDAPTSTLTITGTKSEVNYKFYFIHFYPTKGSSASGIFTWAQSRNGILEFSKDITLTGIANSFAETILTFNSSAAWTPTRTQLYYGNFDALLVGGGGGGGEDGGGASGGGWGGGGGQVLYVTGLSLTSYTYGIGVGAGGTHYTGLETVSQNRVRGGSSVINGPSGTMHTALGGYNGANYVYDPITPAGGTSGNGYVGWSDNAPASAGYVRGGGGGAGAASLGKDGGNGATSNITGTTVYYGGGGGAGSWASLVIGASTGNPGLGGQGGGGRGGRITGEAVLPQITGPALPGTANTGGGGGGAAGGTGLNVPGGIGGSGVVIIKIYA
jgi:hypothetical protein